MNNTTDFEQKIELKHVTEEELTKQLEEELHISEEDALLLIKTLEDTSVFKAQFSSTLEYAELPPGSFGLIVQTKKFTMNLNKFVLITLSAIIGIIPFGNVISVINNIHQFSQAIQSLSDAEKMVYVLLKEIKKSTHKDIDINQLCKMVLKNELNHSLFKTKQDVMNVLDALSKKKLIDILTRSIIVFD